MGSKEDQKRLFDKLKEAEGRAKKYIASQNDIKRK